MHRIRRGRPSHCNQTEVEVRRCLREVIKSISWDGIGTELRGDDDFPRAGDTGKEKENGRVFGRA